MGRVCGEVGSWIDQQVSQPVESFVNQLQQQCQQQACNKWCLCCNQWLCWMAWILVRVVTWVLVTIPVWVTNTVCETVNVFLDLIGFLVSVILSIPFLGGLIRTILNWVTAIFWRIVGFPEFIASLLGLRLRKKMYFGVIVPSVGGTPIATDAAIMPQVNATIDIFDRLCNVNMIFTGICRTDVEPPEQGLKFDCDAKGFFADWGLAGTYFESATLGCRFIDSFRRVIGLGAEVIVFIVNDVVGATGCSFVSSHNYVAVEAKAEIPATPNTSKVPATYIYTMPHEIGHACDLLHRNSSQNLMDTGSTPANPTLTNWQKAIFRWSKHCVYF
jgi:hypothetical protein